MVSPHLPPVQAAVALLPVILGDTLASSDVETSYVSHQPEVGSADGRREITYVPRRGPGRFSRSKIGAVIAGARMAWSARHAISKSDLVHLHSNGFIVEVGAWLAIRFGKPYVMTLYGTDVSAHDPARNARYGGVVRAAEARVFYSQGLYDRGSQLGLTPDPSKVIYAPVSADFRSVAPETRVVLRRELGAGSGPVLLTVKHLRPVGGHDTLLRALPAVLQRHPDAMLWLAGDGDLLPSLEAMCRDLGIVQNVRFLGRLGNDAIWKYYAAADLFVLPSHVESWGTVMLESMACGTPVVTTDTVGGLEVRKHFPDEVTVVLRGDPAGLADAVSNALIHPRRTSQATLDTVQRNFSVAACAAQYLEVYREALTTRK
jgi:glycosyltransferase involved in cell wall biosynthesis